MKTIPYRLKHKLQEVYFVEPNDLGNTTLTTVYKIGTSFLKQMPFIFIIPLSMAFSVMLYVLLGGLVVRLATLLQYGF